MGSGVDHWETILVSGSTCRYLVPGFMVDPGWINREYDDSTWDNGPGGVGYGDNDVYRLCENPNTSMWACNGFATLSSSSRI